jgi:hypothetical protein
VSCNCNARTAHALLLFSSFLGHLDSAKCSPRGSEMHQEIQPRQEQVTTDEVCGLFVWLMASADLYREKSTAGWWMIIQTNRAMDGDLSSRGGQALQLPHRNRGGMISF